MAGYKAKLREVQIPVSDDEDNDVDNEDDLTWPRYLQQGQIWEGERGFLKLGEGSKGKIPPPPSFFKDEGGMNICFNLL